MPTLLPLTLADLQASAPDIPLPLDEAGVDGLVRGLVLPGPVACTARIDLAVDVAADVRGVHMSRFHEAVDAAIEQCGLAAAAPEHGRLRGAPLPGAGLEQLAAAVAREAAARQGSRSGTAHVEATLALPCATPASGLQTYDPVRVVASAVAAADGMSVRTTLEVEVAGITACPCAQELVRQAALERLLADGLDEERALRVLSLVPIATHNQRGVSRLAVETKQPLDPVRLAELARASMSARTHELLKRSDEREVVERAHANPRFVEDCVRELVQLVLAEPLGLADDDRIAARQVNHESIHAHDVHAQLSGTVAELRTLLTR